jgi:hypothetical protein
LASERHAGPRGRPVEVHALLDPFVEGNGMRLGATPPSRGSGPRVTWNCAIDSNIANPLKDCSPGWGGGHFVSAPSDSQVIADTTTGVVSFDVTADVKAGVMSWLVKKADETAHGRGRLLLARRCGGSRRSDSRPATRTWVLT